MEAQPKQQNMSNMDVEMVRIWKRPSNATALAGVHS